MTRKLIPLVALPLMVVLSSCAPTPEERSTTKNGLVVDLLTRIEGCAVYRIEQPGLQPDVYTTICPREGEATTQWTRSCGKGCTRVVQAQTARKVD